MRIIKEFIDRGLIKKDDAIDRAQLLNVIKKSRRSIKSAKLLIEDKTVIKINDFQRANKYKIINNKYVAN